MGAVRLGHAEVAMRDGGPHDKPVAVVTGGSRGIGKAVVEFLAAAGLDVRFTFVSNTEAASALVGALGAQGQSVAATRVDARDAKAVSAFVEQVIAERGRLDVLVNNAAVTADRLLAMMSAMALTGCGTPTVGSELQHVAYGSKSKLTRQAGAGSRGAGGLRVVITV